MADAQPACTGPMGADSGVHSTPSADNPSAHRHWVLGVLLLIYCFSYIDRQIIAVLSPQIKVDLELNDSELGALKGLAFSLFYTTMAIPLAVVGDRWNRVKLIAIAVSFWSVLTAACGLAQNFVQLFIARSGVGMGEAAGNPASHALLADYFRSGERARALGIYQLGVPIGTVVSFVAGSWILDHLGWRLAFMVVGLPGLLLALIVLFTVREIPRGAADEGGQISTSQSPPWHRQALDLLNIPSFRTLMIVGGLQAFGGYAMMMWLVDLSVRLHNLSIQESAVHGAIVLGLGGGLGTAFGGFVADHYGKRHPGKYFLLPGIAMMITGPMLFTALWAPAPVSSMLMFIAFALLFGCMGPFYGLVQMLAPVSSRALAVAIYSLSLSAIGSGLGPFLTGAFSDLLQSSMPEAEALRWALCVVPMTSSFAGIFLIFRRDQVVRDLEA